MSNLMTRSSFENYSSEQKIVADKIMSALKISHESVRVELLGIMTEHDFVAERLDIYFKGLEKAALSGCSLNDAEAVAIREALSGLASMNFPLKNNINR